MKRKFYKTTITYEILSEEPIGDEVSLSDIQEMCDSGPCVGRFKPTMDKPRVLGGKAMADALHEFGSEPGFFNLDDDGKDTSE